MISSSHTQAILIVTQRISKDVIKRYHELESATAGFGDVFLLYHSKVDSNSNELEGVKVEAFTDDILENLGYTAIRKTLVPGSNHFPVLKFFNQHPHYQHYWCIEDDVLFSGNWANFFKVVTPAIDYDFITSHIRKRAHLPKWPWWKTLSIPGTPLAREEMLNSFNPIYRISNKALRHIDLCLKNGSKGHHEVLLPTLLKVAGFKIADFGAEDNHVTPMLSLCTLRTMRWKPVFILPAKNKNLLYHPAKSKITFRQVLVYVKRTIYNQKEYFT